MIELFVKALLGHMIGDYLWQNQWMAIGKSQPGWRGHLACTVHVIAYTIAVMLATGLYTWPMFLGVAIPHWIIDRWSLGKKWINLKNSVPMDEIWERGPVCAQAPPDLMQRNVWKLAFAAPVYIANDNTMHFICLYYLLNHLTI